MSAPPPWQILHGDCLEVLKTLGANSIDAVVTDPPYGLGEEPDPIAMLRHWLAGEDYGQDSRGFMGKAWDSFVPGPRVWREVLRVLKPGGHVLAFFGTRTQDLGVLAMRLAGFQIRDSIGYAWVYGQGFPKSLNIGKAIDAAAGAERKVVGVHRRHGGGSALSGSMAGPLGTSSALPLTSPATPEAAQWEGWGTALKPAWEPIVLARKPLIGTVAANVLAHGTGGLNIDGCRIEGAPRATHGAFNRKGNGGTITTEGLRSGYESEPPSGRWPANVVLDETAAAFLDAQSGESISRIGGRSTGRNFGQDYADTSEKDRARSGHSDSGGASRFFFVAQEDQCESQGNAPDAAGSLSPTKAGKGSAASPVLGGTTDGSAPTSCPARSTRATGSASEERSVNGTRAIPNSDKRSSPASLHGKPIPETCPVCGADRHGVTDITRATTDHSTSNGSAAAATSESTPQNSGPGAQGFDGLRFHYTAKASRDERDGGLELLPATTGGEATSRQDGSAGLNSPRSGAGRTGGARNTHPTVKPVSLMRWLVRLVTPPGGLVLDPFAGSASTGVAALHEGLRFLGIEREAEYVEMARERLTAWAAVHEEFTTIKARASGQMPLFAKANP